MNYLLEIGTEEIPSRIVPTLLKSLQNSTQTLLEKQGILASDTQIQVSGTYRRLTLKISLLKSKQDNQDEWILGPPMQAAQDLTGNWSDAGLGFAKKWGVDISDCTQKEDAKGRAVIAYHKQAAGRPTEEILKENIPAVIKGLELPIAMRWGSQKESFIRPIHWIVSLLNDQVLNLNLWSINASNTSRGHRFLSQESSETFLGKSVEVSFDHYESILEAAFVCVDIDKRRHKIESELAPYFPQKDWDKGLLEELVFLTEWPRMIEGGFSAQYLELPSEILIAYMKKHQRYFPVFKNGTLSTQFLVAADTVTTQNKDLIRQGNERVLKARLEDLYYFWVDDQKRSLESRTAELSEIVFQDSMGSLLDKVNRLRSLGHTLFEANPDLKDRDTFKRATELCKSDLVTQLVQEMPAFQGEVGAYYAKNSGETAAVSTAIKEHYYPRFDADTLAQTNAGAIIGILDRLDTIVACYENGQIPTSSRDPWGIRRSMMAVIRTIIQHRYPFSIQSLVDWVYETLNVQSTQRDLLNKFFLERIRYVFKDLGMDNDIVTAILEESLNTPYASYRRGLLIQNYRQTQVTAFKTFLETGIRIQKILANHPSEPTVHASLFQDPIESKVWDSFKILHTNPTDDHQKRISILAAVSLLMGDYFEKILVMDKDPQIKQNRLNMLGLIHQQYQTLADFSHLEGS